MKINKPVILLVLYAKEAVAFGAATILSCGASQLFGLIKLVVDSSLLVSSKLSKHKISNNLKIINENWSAFTKTETIKNIAKKLGKGDANAVTQAEAQAYFMTKAKKNDEKISRLYRSLRADAVAFVPLAGAHLSWRIATNYSGRRFSAMYSRSVAQALEHHSKTCSRLLFLGRGQGNYQKPHGYLRCTIPVETSTKKRSIDAYFATPNGEGLDQIQFSKRPLVVLFHPAVGSASSMQNVADIYREKNYNVLCVTAGGYSGSAGVTTSEKSIIQDIEAIKQYLKANGVTQVAYHGWSMGSGLAFQASAGDSDVQELETLFVVADRPYNSAEGVGKNLVGSIGKGWMRAAFPRGRLVELPGGKWIQTNGLDNLQKAETLKKKNIPLFCVRAPNDFLMGRKKENGIHLENFAIDLLKKRYPEGNVKRDDHLININGGHFHLVNENNLSSIFELLN